MRNIKRPTAYLLILLLVGMFASSIHAAPLYPLISIEDLAKSPDKFDGQKISVQGILLGFMDDPGKSAQLVLGDGNGHYVLVVVPIEAAKVAPVDIVVLGTFYSSGRTLAHFILPTLIY